MNFFGKATKIASIALMAAGGAITVGSAAMLGVGTNYTYTIKDGVHTTKMGVGSMNYGKSWMDGKEINAGDYGPKSYDDFRKQVSDTRKYLEDQIKQLEGQGSGQAEAINGLKKQLEMFDAVDTAYGLMVAGAVLVSFSSVALIVGAVLFTIITIKNKK